MTDSEAVFRTVDAEALTRRGQTPASCTWVSFSNDALYSKASQCRRRFSPSKMSNMPAYVSVPVTI